MLCSRCKKEIPNESIFCNWCGKRQTAIEPKQKRKRFKRPNGNGTISKYSGERKKPFVARLDGKLIGTFRTYEEADEVLTDIIARKQACMDVILNKYISTFTDVHNAFIQSKEYEKIGEKGKYSIASAYKRFESLHDKVFTKILAAEYESIIDSAVVLPAYKIRTPEEIKKMSAKERDRYNALISKPQEALSYSAKSKLKQYIIHLYNTAISNKIETVNYGQNIVLDKASNKIKRRNFTKSEKDLLYKNDNDDIVKIILIYLELGFRLNELLSLPTSRIDFENDIIQWGSKTDAGKDRIIPLVGKAREYVKYFYGDGSQKFLIERNGKRIREEYFRIHMFYPTLDRLGIEYSDENSRFNVITPHRIRHTFAADSVKAGVAPEALKEIIGHAQYSTTINKYNDDVDVDYLKKELQKKG